MNSFQSQWRLVFSVHVFTLSSKAGTSTFSRYDLMAKRLLGHRSLDLTIFRCFGI